MVPHLRVSTVNGLLSSRTNDQRFKMANGIYEVTFRVVAVIRRQTIATSEEQAESIINRNTDWLEAIQDTTNVTSVTCRDYAIQGVTCVEKSIAIEG